MINHKKNNSYQAHGFTLMELMFAIAILGVGLIAIASIFPVAGIIQRKTTYSLMAQQVNDNVRVMLSTRGIRLSELNGGGKTIKSGVLTPIPEILGKSANSTNVYWSLADRTFPSREEDPLQRPYVWVPMVLKDKSSWKVYIFILRAGRDFNYKRIGSSSDWANYDDGKTKLGGGGTVYRMPGVKKFRISNVRVDRTNPNDPETTMTIKSKGAIQLGSIIVTGSGKIWRVTRVLDDTVGISTNLTKTEEDALKSSGVVWTAVAQPNEQDIIDMPNPLVDVVVIGAGAFKP